MKTLILLVMMLAGLSAVGNASTTCTSTHNTGAGPTALTFCITSNGGIASMIAGGYVLLNGAEGYAICLPGGGSRYDIGTSDSGDWSPGVIIQPNGPNTFPITITRSTTDGNITITQGFAYANAGKSIRVKTTIFSYFHGVNLLVRYADVAGPAQTADHVTRSAFVYNQAAIGMIASPVPSSMVSADVVLGGATDPCSASAPPTLPFSGDTATWLSWTFNGLKTFKAQFDYAPMW